MNKKIRITADDDAIKIMVDGKITAVIKNEDKSEVDGQTIFSSLNYSPKDKYEIEPFDLKEEEAKKNYKAAEMIYGLYVKIVDGINDITVDHQSSEEKHKEAQ